MRIVEITEFGGPEVLNINTVPDPEPGPGEVLIRVRATSVNPVDIQLRRGDYSDAVNLPAKIGVDVAGVITKVGPGASRFEVGDEVFYVPRLLENEGSYADFHVEQEAIVAKKPQSLTFAQAAALPLAAGTAWECLIERARLQAGQRVLIHGGSGGVGVYALQIASGAGAYVATTCRSENFDMVKNLGANICFDYREPDLYTRLASDPREQFDVILDTVGGNTIENSLNLLKPFGQVVSIVDQSTPQNLVSGWAVNGSVHFVFTTQSAARLERLSAFVDSGLLKPVIEKSYTLDEVVEAHRDIERGQRSGKIVLTTE
ncbi:MAG: zinc-binding dehydrogenase [Sphingorhabdus sp.]|nr:zinc-binding dehydrogenase [Sphingorhabdus sp.]